MQPSTNTETPAAALVLMYHRIATSAVDPWSLCVSAEHFAEQLDVLTRLTAPVPLSWLWDHRRQAFGTRRMVALTFDDGYVDNLSAAVPLLDRSGVPATMFVTTGKTGSTREFWWDALERVLLHPGALPPEFRIEIGGRWHSWDLAQSAQYSSVEWAHHRAWKTDEPPPAPRQALFLELWRLLHPLPNEEQERAVDALMAWASVPSAARPACRTLSASEVQILAASEWIDIGAHTVTHPVLSQFTPDVQQWEMETSKGHLESLVGRPVTSFAYPYGAHGEATMQIAEAAGFKLACTTRAQAVGDHTQPLAVPRLQVMDWNGVEFERRLSAWLAGRTEV